MMWLLHHLSSMLADVKDPVCQALVCTKSTGIPAASGDLGTIAGKVMKGIFGLMGSIAVVAVMVGGLQYVVSGGDPKRTAQAKETILYAAIGIVISIFAYAIVTFISKGLS